MAKWSVTGRGESDRGVRLGRSGSRTPSRAAFDALAEHAQTRQDAVLLPQRAAGEGASGSTRGACALETTDAFRHGVRFLFQRRFMITDHGTLKDVAPKKGKNAAEPLVLRRVSELVRKKMSIFA